MEEEMNFGLDVLNNALLIGEETPDWSHDGLPKKVYMIPLNSLYYNDDNGRIATWISSYNDTNNQQPLSFLSLTEYNNVLHEFVKKSNSPDTFKKSLNDIKLKGQVRPGVVLRDGRIVSGNRRFTILRELYSSTGSDKYNYFKCFIEDKDLSKAEDRKYIKTIERLTQFGVDEKVDYDPIDRLVDIYNDLIGPNRIWEKDEYAKKLSLKVSEIDKMFLKASIMADYLNFINKPNKFYIAKNYKLDGPLQELITTFKKSSTEEWNRIRTLFYSFFHEKGDTTRHVRDLNKIYKNNPSQFDILLDKQINSIEKKEAEIIANYEVNLRDNTSGNISEINKDFKLDSIVSEDTKKEVFAVSNKVKVEEKRKDKVNKIFSSFRHIVVSLLDTELLMTTEEKYELSLEIAKLEKILQNFKEKNN